MRIGVIGAGYVGLSIACLLSQDNDVVVVDISEDRVQKINRREAPFKDSTISAFFSEKQLNLSATIDYQKVKKSDFIIISVPTNYDEETSKLDTSIVESSIEKALHYSPKSTIVVKSTVGIGFTEKMASLYPKNTILFSPEFLREGKALYDNLYPSRIVVGGLDKKAAKDFGNLLKEHALNNPKVIISSSGSAEAIKLFSNTYLALRVAFFNELDTFAIGKHLSAREIIRGISADPRIGDYSTILLSALADIAYRRTRNKFSQITGTFHKILSALLAIQMLQGSNLSPTKSSLRAKIQSASTSSQ